MGKVAAAAVSTSMTREGFLQRHLTPLLKPALASLLEDRPADPCKYLLQRFQSGKTPSDHSLGSGPNSVPPKEYGARIHLLIREVSAIALECFEQPTDLVPSI